MTMLASYVDVETIPGMDNQDGGAASYVTPQGLGIGNNVIQEAIRQAQMFERIGRASVAVTHDFSNFITGILGIIREVQENLGVENPQSNILEIAANAAQRANSLSKGLLSMGRREVLSWQPINLNSVIKEMKPFLKRMVGDHVEIHMVLDDSLGLIEGSAVKMEQVIFNLVLNARDAMPTGGLITLETRNISEIYGVGHPSSVRLEVRDTGIGMDANTQRKIFEPFFTTKAKTQGTGIGLATLKTIVEDHHGEVVVTSKLNHGTQFSISLPCVSFS